MLKEQSTNRARVCETCQSAVCTVYCRADAAYLCTSCDTRIHAANLVASRHERVWVCQACELAPAAFMCKADSASLCASCDADIHSVNPLARRHHRVPILPIPGCLYGPAATHVPAQERIEEDEDEYEAASWLLQNPIKENTNNNQNINGFLFGGEVVDEYLDLDEYNSSCNDENQFTDIDQNSDGVDPQKSYRSGNIGGDRVVPVENAETKGYNYQFGIMECHENSKPTTPCGYPASISHSVSVSSMDACVVPESTRSSDVVSVSIRTPKGTIDIFSNNPPIQMPPQLTPVDREARVLRYREKKKTRKFEKTIRYASRKAYAETRPRIKGRFAKRTTDHHVEVEVDQMFSTALMAGEGGYGIVPSFRNHPTKGKRDMGLPLG